MESKKVLFYSAMPYDIEHFTKSNNSLPEDKKLSFEFCPDVLDHNNACLSKGFDVVCLFVNDKADKLILDIFAANEVKMIALRCAGFNQVDLEVAKSHGIKMARVPAYSPFGVAEHAMALALGVIRKTHKAYNRVRNGNFSLTGLEGFNLHGKTVGLIGTGLIGRCFANICKGFGMKIIAFDIYKSQEFIDECGGTYTDLDTLYAESDVISLHVPLNDGTKHIISYNSIQKMKTGVVIVNSGRGALVNTQDAIEGIKSGKIGGLGLDVYENEQKLFFKDLSNQIIQDDLFQLLISFPNVLVTAHQAFFTTEALNNISDTTVSNMIDIFTTGKCVNEV